MASAGNLQPMPPFDPKMDVSAAGPEVEAIFDTLPNTGQDDDFKTACEKLTEYFSPSKSVPFEVYKFRQAKQHETLDAYYTRLCTLAKTSLARTDQQTKEIIKKDISDGNEEYTNQLQQDHRRPITTSKYSSSSSKICFKCGLGFPHRDNQKCPAVDKECYKCHKRGHFARVCKTTGGATSSFQHVNKVDKRHSSTHKSTSNSSSDSDSGSEHMFTIQQAQQSKHPYTTVGVNGVPVKMMVDSGASVNVFGPEDFEHLSKQSKEPISFQKPTQRFMILEKITLFPY
ncbi:Transposon Ty3-I Gag-Pol poly [Paramuricea clavata]|uniref:Transposon Ty3-I Gag-Pol poly n=1 Tax=Paramuricea clavata TaxID=317549 RepID=A0A7D9LUK4_PARCT|nr:Transposon Ty3-I Gag-Pol poly [Paramuricea clavata]